MCMSPGGRAIGTGGRCAPPPAFDAPAGRERGVAAQVCGDSCRILALRDGLALIPRPSAFIRSLRTWYAADGSIVASRSLPIRPPFPVPRVPERRQGSRGGKEAVMTVDGF